MIPCLVAWRRSMMEGYKPFAGYSAWFSSCVHSDTIDKWNAHGGGFGDQNSADYLFSDSGRANDTLSVYKTQKRSLVVHSSWIDYIVDNGCRVRDVPLLEYVVIPSCRGDGDRRVLNAGSKLEYQSGSRHGSESVRNGSRPSRNESEPAHGQHRNESIHQNGFEPLNQHRNESVHPISQHRNESMRRDRFEPLNEHGNESVHPINQHWNESVQENRSVSDLLPQNKPKPTTNDGPTQPIHIKSLLPINTRFTDIRNVPNLIIKRTQQK